MFKIEGKAAIFINGKKKCVGDNLAFQASVSQTEASVGRTGVAGFVENPVPSRLTGQVIDVKGNTDGIDKIRDATIVIERLDGAEQWTMMNACWEGDPFELDSTTGRGDFKFMSPSEIKKTKG